MLVSGTGGVKRLSRMLEGWGLMTQLHVFHSTTSHNVQRVTVFCERSLMYGFKVCHCEVMLKVVLITLLTAEPYGFPS